jgi:Uma2 family endonuclease
MAIPVTTQPITVADVQRVDGLDEYKGMEIVNGVWTPKHKGDDMSVGHGSYGINIILLMGPFVKEHRLGELYMPETIFTLSVQNNKVEAMRKPDIAFVSASKVIANPAAYYFQAPDLAIEIVSPSDTPQVIHEKMTDYFTYGTQQMWLVYPKQQKIVVHFPDGTAHTYQKGESVPGGDLLPGFELKVADVFER